MVGLISPLVSQIGAIVCAFLALIIILGLGVEYIFGSKKRENKEKTNTGFNITIDSRDFISMDIKRIKAVFDGLEKIIKRNQEKQKKG